MNRHGWHFDKNIVMVRMTFPALRNPSVQFFDIEQERPPESYPYWYKTTPASLNRLLKALQGWSVQALDTGAWEWRKPAQGVTIEDLKEIRDLLRTSTPPVTVYTFDAWPVHKCNRAAGELTRLIEKMEEKP
jgi:hypothetical protein